MSMVMSEEKRALIARIRSLPVQLEMLVNGLTDNELTAHPLPDEWSIAQNVHHLADVHMHYFIRLKYLLTEPGPVIKPFHQNDWAETADAVSAQIGASLGIILGVHARFVNLIESLPDADWLREGINPNSGPFTVESLVNKIASHGEAHLAQIHQALAAMD
jgi:hypothetical protein